jgi:C-methyltransferase
VDVPHVIAHARAVLVKLGLSSRCEAVAGDFFESVPEADLYLLKSVIHDWDDEQSIRILANCADSMRADGRVLVIETLLPEDDRPSSAPLIDINMMVLTPGRERTTGEYAALLNAAGLRIDRVIETQTPMQIIEARR